MACRRLNSRWDNVHTGDGNNPENYVSAYVWYALARRGGVEQSDKMVDEIEAGMTPEQLSDARKRVEDSRIGAAK